MKISIKRKTRWPVIAGHQDDNNPRLRGTGAAFVEIRIMLECCTIPLVYFTTKNVKEEGRWVVVQHFANSGAVGQVSSVPIGGAAATPHNPPRNSRSPPPERTY